MTDADGTWTDESDWELVESDTGEEGDDAERIRRTSGGRCRR